MTRIEETRGRKKEGTCRGEGWYGKKVTDVRVLNGLHTNGRDRRQEIRERDMELRRRVRVRGTEGER